MQTFLPFEQFKKSAESLDKRRCWKQVVEAKQILCNLHASFVPEDWKETLGWANQGSTNHPAVKMWVGYESLLAHYYNVFLDHCLKVHRIKTTMPFVMGLYSYGYDGSMIESDVYPRSEPYWLGQGPFHRAMRARLIEKDREFYLPKWPNDEGYNDGNYWWPVMEDKTFRII